MREECSSALALPNLGEKASIQEVMMIDSFPLLPVRIGEMISKFLPHLLLSLVHVWSSLHLIHAIVFPLIHQKAWLHRLSYAHILPWASRETAVSAYSHHLVFMALSVIASAS